ncbi:MAG: hypothetical protein OXQ29_19705 [Rhodospirillaceae bacterium]|nr:hypothetical protein [Rhodospirillaceae bacterium]
MKTVAYLRVSTPQHDVSSQRLAILEYARLDELTSVLPRGDRLVVSQLSRLGRSLGQRRSPRLPGWMASARR